MSTRWLCAALMAVVASGPVMAAETPAGTPAWVKVETTAPGTSGPPVRTHHAAIYDPVGYRMLVFGGRNSSGPLDDTWSLDLKTARWTAIPGDVKPPARYGHSAIYDPLRHRMVIFAGQKTGGFFNDVWALDLNQNRWSELQPKAAAGSVPAVPKIRYGSTAIYDPQRDRMVTFAGFTDVGRFNDTWAFDLKQEQWTDLSPGGTRPVKRCLLTSAYDRLRDRMIIYAGQMSGHLMDTWAFDLAKNSWTEIKSTPIPPGRFFSALVDQPEQRRAVLFGGQNSNLGALDDIWALNLDSDRWEALTPAGGTKPAARGGHSAIYDPVERRMVIFAGDGQETYADVWALTNLAPKP